MRINHNLPAMNTYRNLSGNNNKVSKSLEKLSSGLAINRAGDNAAGLAISEKMRAQIRGLDQGSANAQDGISMIQTAESALGETHDILQRMRELADQAANDTYADDDRSEIQKEINQLTSEINRIGNTTEFNTQKLLNGGKTEVTLKTITEGASQAKVQGQQISNGDIGGTQNKLMEGDKAEWSMTIAQRNVVTSGVPLKDKFTVGNLEGEIVTVSQEPAGMLATGEDYKISNNKLYVKDGATADIRAKAMAEYGNKLSNGDYTFASNGTDLSIKANYSDVKMNNQLVSIDGTERDLTHGATNDDNKAGAVTQGSAAHWTGAMTSVMTTNTSTITFLGKQFTLQTASAAEMGIATAQDSRVSGNSLILGTGVTATNKAALVADFLSQQSQFSDYTFTAVANSGTFDVSASRRGNVANAASVVGFTVTTSGSENQVAATSIENVVQDKEAIAAKWEAKLGTIPENGSSYMFGFNGINIDIKKGSDSDFSGSQTSKFETTSMGNTLLVKNPADKEAVAKALADAFNTIKNGRSEISSKAAGFDFSSQGDKIIITDSLTNGDKNNGLKVTNGDAEKLVDVQREGRAQVTKQFEYTFENAFQRDGSTFKIGGQTFTAKNNPVSGNEFKTTTNVQDQLADIADLINKDAKLKANYAATVEGNKLIVKQKETGALKGGAEDASKMTVGGNDAIQGESVFKIDELKQVGGSYNINGISIRVTDDVSDAGLADGTAVLHSADKETQATNLTNAIMSNEKLLQQFSNATADGNTIRLTQSKGGSDLKTTEVGAKATEGDGYQAKLQIGANSGQSMTLKIGDMRAAALKVSGTEDGSRTVTSSTGQIASYVAVANVTNGTDDDSVEYALDVSTHDKATAAIDVINDAIKTVSAQRSQLGAYQNRLDHTINNLGTSSENLSSAESRIRDVDMAKEMMNYQKNNILSQAAQSMLAQANQLPQGVLQLLG